MLRVNYINYLTVTKGGHSKELNKKIPRQRDGRILTVTSITFDQYLDKYILWIECISRRSSDVKPKQQCSDVPFNNKAILKCR